jgi:hypothetical protein
MGMARQTNRTIRVRAENRVARVPAENRVARVGRQLTEAYLASEVLEILERAGVNIIERDTSRRNAGDILASRRDIGFERRFAIEIIREINPETIKEQYSRFKNQLSNNKRLSFEEFDEYWVVGASFATEQLRRRPENDRRFHVVDVGEFRKLFTPPSARKTKTRARTRIGQAVEASAKEINLAIAGLILQIDAKLEPLRRERPNSDDAISRVQAEISEYERMRAELGRIREMVAGFKKGKEPEKEVVEATKTFRQSVEDLWDKHQDTILAYTSKAALYVSMVGLLALMKADSATAVAGATAIAANVRVTGAKKKIGAALKKLGKRLSDE